MSLFIDVFGVSQLTNAIDCWYFLAKSMKDSISDLRLLEMIFLSKILKIAWGFIKTD